MNKCQFCNAEFNSISSLNYHKESAKYCLKIQGKNVENYKCDACDKSYTSKKYLDKHLELCKKQKSKSKNSELENTIKEIINEKEKEIKNLKEMLIEKDRQIRELKEMFDRSNEIIAEIAKQPKINNTTNNIRGNQNIKNFLTNSKTYEEQTDYDRIISIAKDADMEKYFWRGQKGLAQFCVEHIAKTQDGKMIICCTDPSRARFKHINEKNELCEDIDARIFTSKISEPIKEVVEEVHNNIQKGLEDRLTYSECDSNFLSSKKNLALEKYIEIKNINNNQYNKEYKKELSVLLNI